jgi:death on curing protein
MIIKKINIIEVQFTAYRLAQELMRFDEPIPDFDTRYPNVLESCVATPFQVFDGKVLYSGLLNKASILFYLMIKNHPFENGNKRIAMVTLFLFLGRNGKWLRVKPRKLYKFAANVAGSKPKYKDRVLRRIRNFLKKHIQPSDVSARALH